MQDASACLVDERGRVLFAVEEERLVRRKNTGELPEQAIRACLAHVGATWRDLDHVAFSLRPWEGVVTRAMDLLRGWPDTRPMLQSRGASWLRVVDLPRELRRRFGPGRHRWHWVRHHDAHAASAFLPSPFESAAVLIVDGSGEIESLTHHVGRSTQVARLGGLGDRDFPHSLGYFYSALTEWAGFVPATSEGKTMGLSAFVSVEPALLAAFREMVRDDGRLDLSWFGFQHGGTRGYFSPRWVERFGPARTSEAALEERHFAVAAAGQRRLEEVVFARLRALHRATRLDRLCLAGGVALNAVMNGKIREETPFREVFVQPAAHDAGTAWGAALLARGPDAPRPAPLTSMALGPDLGAFTPPDGAERPANLAEMVATLLADGEMVGWVQGRLELGPRALGQRSILADPRAPDMADRVNRTVKRRETFRPFAPAVLESAAGDWFEGTMTPFMTTVCRVRPDQRARVPAITHVDGTARPQLVSAEFNPRLHALITAFAARTGVPMVLNTSFNLRDEPIVNRPEEALRDFEATDLDALVLGDWLMRKR